MYINNCCKISGRAAVHGFPTFDFLTSFLKLRKDLEPKSRQPARCNAPFVCTVHCYKKASGVPLMTPYNFSCDSSRSGFAYLRLKFQEVRQDLYVPLFFFRLYWQFRRSFPNSLNIPIFSVSRARKTLLVPSLRVAARY